MQTAAAATPAAAPAVAAPMAAGGAMPQNPMMTTGGAMPPAQAPMGGNPTMMGGGMPPAYAMGGGMPNRVNPVGKFFSDINMVEAGLLALGVATFLYAIAYYRLEMAMSKSGYADLSARMQKMESEMAAKKAQEQAANANGMARRARKRMLI